MQMYIFRDPESSVRQSATIGRPFTLTLWIIIFGCLVITLGVLSVMHAIAVSKWAPLNSLSAGFSLLADLSLRMHFGRTAQLATFTSTKLASALWLLLWGLVILQLYQANLKAYLSVSDRLNLPFTDFEGFIEQLRYIFTL